ncbi:MAG: uncharacterized protein A8A55_2723, partial [Amphiamblys sp. WSBS2006]
KVDGNLIPECEEMLAKTSINIRKIRDVCFVGDAAILGTQMSFEEEKGVERIRIQDCSFFVYNHIVISRYLNESIGNKKCCYSNMWFKRIDVRKGVANTDISMVCGDENENTVELLRVNAERKYLGIRTSPLLQMCYLGKIKEIELEEVGVLLLPSLVLPSENMLEKLTLKGKSETTLSKVYDKSVYIGKVKKIHLHDMAINILGSIAIDEKYGLEELLLKGAREEKMYRILCRDVSFANEIRNIVVEAPFGVGGVKGIARKLGLEDFKKLKFLNEDGTEDRKKVYRGVPYEKLEFGKIDFEIDPEDKISGDEDKNSIASSYTRNSRDSSEMGDDGDVREEVSQEFPGGIVQLEKQLGNRESVSGSDSDSDG